MGCEKSLFYTTNPHVKSLSNPFIWFLLVQITNKCLPSILKLQYLEDLVLEGCFGIDDDSLAVLKQGCKSLEVSKFGKINESVIYSCHFILPYI